MADPQLPEVLSTEDDHVVHPVETDEDVEAATSDDVHDADRGDFPEAARFTDEQWAAVEAARAAAAEEG